MSRQTPDDFNPGFDDLLGPAPEPVVSRAEQNRRNRRTHGLSQTPEYECARGLVKEASQLDLPVYEPWLDGLGALPRYVLDVLGERPSRRHLLRCRVESLGVVPGNLVWVDVGLRPPRRRVARSAAYRQAVVMSQCLCDFRLAADCPCERAEFLRHGP